MHCLERCYAPSWRNSTDTVLQSYLLQTAREGEGNAAGMEQTVY